MPKGATTTERQATIIAIAGTPPGSRRSPASPSFRISGAAHSATAPRPERLALLRLGAANLATDPILTGMAMASAANPIAEDDSLLANRHYEDIPNLQAPYPSQLIYVE